MKKLICIFLAMLLFCVPVLAEQASPVLTILKGECVQNTLTVWYCLYGRVSGQEVTALVYDGQENLLSVHQQTVKEDGVNSITVSFTKSYPEYRVVLGGTDISRPRQIVLSANSGYEASAIPFTEGMNAGQLLAYLKGMTDLGAFREIEIPKTDVTNTDIVTPDEVAPTVPDVTMTALSDQDLLLPGDWIEGNLAGSSLGLFTVINGDVDLNGKVDAADALLVLRYAVGKGNLSELGLVAANPTGQSPINAAHALSILQYAVGKIPAL
jgi:hypothetical protein